MNKNAIRYRDVMVAPGSQLFEAIQAGDTQRAAQIYKRCEDEAIALQYGITVADLEHYRNQERRPPGVPVSFTCVKVCSI
jgi:hypothetical protein